MPATEVPTRWWAPSSAQPSPRQAETADDKRRYVEDGLVPVSCERCAIEVLVRKNSDKHTSVQWTTDSRACPEIAAQVAAGTPGAQVLGCSALKGSIATAARDGLLAVAGD